jgi:microcystin-dependent protein
MAQPFISEIRTFSFNYAPRGWALCNGQILPINQYQALFSLIGTYYGGNGTTNFALPNLQGRLAIGFGQGNGLQNYTIGQSAGEASHTLLTPEMPMHTHSAGAFTVPGAPTNVPSSSVILASASTSESGNPGVLAYGTGAINTPIAPLGLAGGGQPHENQMPYLVLNYCIALEGIFPSQS